ncbi:MAG: hypothetical protein J5I93_28720 [Pirellulaceae bacterium]|nr:hypothetical protein [Pirellulaceae bacterium]
MLTLLILTLFLIALVVSLEGGPRFAPAGPRRMAHGGLGSVSLLAGCGVALGLFLAPGSQLGPATLWAAAQTADSTDPAPADPPPADNVSTASTATAATSPTPADELEIDGGLPRVVIPYEQRPEWVDAQPDLAGDVHRVVVTAGPYERKSECVQALDDEKQKAVAQYINDYLGSSRASLLVRYDLETINRRLLKAENVHEEVIQVSLGPMHQVHALLEFDPEFRAELDAAWRDVRAGVRLGQTGLIVFGVLGLLGVAFSYFKLDTATRGYYSGKLQLLAALAILALLGAGLVMSGWIPRL